MERVFALFPRLAERRDQKAGTMSGGEQQMCAIGRALMARPEAADAGRAVDGPRADLRRADLRDRRSRSTSRATPILLVEQNALMALEVAHRGYVLETGRIVLDGPAAALRTSRCARRTSARSKTEADPNWPGLAERRVTRLEARRVRRLWRSRL